MKPITSFLRNTLTGGILFLLPIVLLIMILGKAWDILLKLSAPLTEKMPELILGFDGSKLVTILLLIMICFIGGLVFRSRTVRKKVTTLEENVLTYLPGYSLVKSIASDALGDTTGHNMTTVLLQDGDSWNIAFLVDEDGDFCTIFIPEAPRHDSGEVKIVPASSIKKVDVPTHAAARSLKQFGKGASAWLRK